MSLTADFEYKTMGKTERLQMKGGDADTLFKGAILCIDANGYMEVPTDAASVVPLGVCVEQVVEDGTHLDVEVERGIIAVPKRVLQVTVFTFVNGGASNIDYNDEYFDIYDGVAGWRVWFNVNSAGTPPAADGLTLAEVAIATGDSVTQAATAATTVIDAIASFGATSALGVVTIVGVTRGYSHAPAKAATLADSVATLSETDSGRAVQNNIGELFYAIADDGVVRASGKSTADIEAGLCLGIINLAPAGGDVDLLFIDFRQKTLGD